MVAAVSLLADVASKGMILDHRFDLPVSLVQGWLALVLTFNRGMSFSLLNDASLWWGPWLLGGIAAAVSVALVQWMGERRDWMFQLGLGLILAGALGNLLDRLRFGQVVDFILFYRGNWAFPAFNVADSCITVGVVVLLLESLCYKPAK
jgi:signal peptidase II